MCRQIPYLGLIRSGFILRQHRYKGLGKRALGKQAAQEIGDLEGHQKGVRGGIRAEDTGKHHVPQQSHDTGQEGHGTDHGGGFEEAHR